MDENKKHIDQLKKQGWEQMSSMLDEHMPGEKKRPIIWWYWAAGAAALVLAVTIPLTLLTNGDSADPTTAMVDQESVISPGDKNTTPSDDDIDTNGNIASTPQNDGPLVGVDSGDDALDDTYSPDYVAKDIKIMSKNQDVAHSDRNANVQKEIEETPSDNMDMIDGLEGDDIALSDHGVKRLDQQSIQIEIEHNYPTLYIKDEPMKIKSPQSAGRISASVFSEMMWSFSDRFGFVNAGPGINYGFGKWAVGLSGGVTVPLPHQKAFYSSNLPFSGQYNFNKQHESINQDASLSSNSSAVYYEKYSMKPGFIVSLSAQRQLTDYWGFGIGVGRIGFRYDFTQKAEPNQNNIATRTELSGLQNSLWYGSLSAHYQMGRHWKIHGGIRMINLLQAGAVGVLPAVRMEYVLN